jgi:hypothetical protein
MGPRFTIEGTAERFGDLQRNIRMSNAEEWRLFCQRHGYRRNIDWAETAQPLFTIDFYLK